MRRSSQIEPDTAARYRSEEDPYIRVGAEDTEDVCTFCSGEGAIEADATNGMGPELGLNDVECFSP